MPKAIYVCPSTLFDAEREKALKGEHLGGISYHLGGEASSCGRDYPGMSIVQIEWGNWRDREKFEVQPDVIVLGDPWEPMPADAVPYIEAARQATADTRNAESIPKRAKLALIARTDPDAPIDASHTVGQAFRKAFPQGFGR